MLTLGQVQNSSVANVAGVNVTDPQFAIYVNDAVRQLMDLGNWWGTVCAMTGQVVQGCMTWPHKIDTVLAIDLDYRSERLSNYWYSFIPISGKFAGLVTNPTFCSQWGCGMNHESVVEFSGTQPMFAGPTIANPFAISVTADNPVDYGQTVTIYGQDVNGVEITSLRSDGTTQRGIQLTLAAVGPSTGTIFSYVSDVVKDITVGNVKAWATTPTAPLSSLCAVWSGSQTSPQFLFSRLSNVPANKTFCMTALIKLGFEPVTQAADILPLGNLDAIKSMVQAIRKREAGADDEADKFEKTAVRRLNMELRTRFPIEQTTIMIKGFGTADPRRHGIGRIN